MPPIETDLLFQTAVLWPASGTDAYGEPTVGNPEEVDCRWLTKRREAYTPDGQKVVLDATVIVDQEIACGGKMWLGTLDDWYGTGSSGSDTGLMEIKTYDETPDLKDIEIRRQVGLMRFRNTLPT